MSSGTRYFLLSDSARGRLLIYITLILLAINQVAILHRY